MKIRVGLLTTKKVGDMEENTIEGKIRGTRKEMVGCVHASQ